jgi:signal peptidase I
MAMTTEVRASLKLDLAAEVLRGGGSVRLRAWGVSMLPSIWPGDLLTIESARLEQITPGDIVVIRQESRFIVHRLIRMEEGPDRTACLTRGDAVSHDDAFSPTSALLGRVTSICRASRAFSPNRQVSPVAGVFAWLFCHWDQFRSVYLRAHAFVYGLD